MKTAQDLPSTLHTLRRRLAAQLFVRRLALAALVAVGSLVALAAVARSGVPPAWSWPAVWAVLSTALLWAVSATLRAPPSLAAAAGVVDRAAATRDRFATALEFSQSGSGELRTVALLECSAYVRGRSFAPALPWQWPREARWLWVPLLALALLRWDAQVAAAHRAVLAAEAGKAAAPAISALQELARTLAPGAGEAASTEGKRLAEELRRSAERLRAEAEKGGDAQKAALRELSALEELVRQAQEEQRAQFSPAELREVAQALRDNPATEEAGQQLERGELAAGAANLEKQAEALSAAGNERTAEEIQKALRAALERVAQQQPLSPSARQAAQQSGAASETLKKLAQLLRQMPGQRGASPGSAGEQMSPQALQKLLSQLEEMKQGDGEAGHPGAPKGDDSRILMQAFDHRSSEDPAGGQNMQPTGLPGGEHDQGTTASPFAEKPNPGTQKGADLALSGQAGAGETASQLLPGATSDDSKARRKYKALYDAMAPAAEAAVQQENIPLGSRFFVKRYFEAIRPKE